MAIGNLNTPITFITTTTEKDKEGFAKKVTHPILCVRSYMEAKNTSEKWANNAIFQDVSALFRIRYIPNKTITTDMQIECYAGTFDIVSVENIRGKNMYIEILAKKVEKPNAKGNNEPA